MTANEKAVMTDCYRFLEAFSSPPPNMSGESPGWWERAAEALKDLGARNRQHPLAIQVGSAIYSYLSEKADAVSRKAVGE